MINNDDLVWVFVVYFYALFAQVLYFLYKNKKK